MFNRQRHSHASADAQRSETALGDPHLHFVQQRDQHAATGSANGVIKCNDATVNVDLARVPAHFLVDRTSLGRKGFADFQKAKIGGFSAGFFPSLT